MSSENSPLLKKVIINGVDVSSYITRYEVVDEYTAAVGTCSITLNRNVIDVLPMDDSLNNKPVTIQRGVLSATEKYIFRGEIISISLAGGFYSIGCKNKYYEAQRMEINTSFDINIDSEHGKISEIFQTIVNDYTTTLVADTSSVQDSGNLILLTKFVCNHAQIFERLDVLAKALNWQHYYEPVTDKIYFEPKGFIDSGTTLTVGAEIVNVPTWKYNSDNLINQLTVLGAQQMVQKTIFQNGTAADAQFVLMPFVPVSVKTYVGTGSFDPNGTGTKPSDNNANLKTGGKKGTTSGSYDYYYDDDKEVRKVFFSDTSYGSQPSFTPASGTNNIEVQYSYNLPTPVFGKRQISIDTYQLHEKTIKREDIKNVSDAEIFLDKYLDKYQSPLINTSILVDGTNDIVVGRLYRVVDGNQGIDRQLVALKSKKFFPYKPDEIDVGQLSLEEDDFETNIWDRIKRIEEKESETSDFLIQIFGLNDTISYEPRYTELQVNSIVGETGVYGHPIFGRYGTSKYGSTSGSGFILGHPTFGKLGSSVLGSSGMVTVTIRILQGNNTYKEFVYDDTFYDNSLSTGVTWDTTLKKISLSSGGELYTRAITLGTTYRYATLIFGDFVGACTVYISADGKANWQEITQNTRTLLLNTNSNGVFLRIIDSTFPSFPITFPFTFYGQPVIQNTYKTSGQYNLPAINLKLEE